MEKKEKQIHDLMNTLSRIKKLNSHCFDNDNMKLRPSEIMFLIKISDLENKKLTKINDLINHLKFAPSTVSTILGALEEDKYIERKVNPDNRREGFIELTSKGKSLVKKTKQNHMEIMAELILYLGEDNTDALVNILDKVSVFFENKRGKNK